MVREQGAQAHSGWWRGADRALACCADYHASFSLLGVPLRLPSCLPPSPCIWHACAGLRAGLCALGNRSPASCLPISRAPPSLCCPPCPADFQEEEYVHALGDRMFNSEPERAGQRILKDFRTLALGRICLELPQQYEHVREV